MSNPDDDTDVPSGFHDDAEMERTSPRTSEIAAVALGLFRYVDIRSSTAIFDGPAAQTHHAHRKRRVICKA